jgi:hypothetical protein
VASAPITRGAAAPHRVSRDARAADTSGERLTIGRPVSNIRSVWSTPGRVQATGDLSRSADPRWSRPRPP